MSGTTPQGLMGFAGSWATMKTCPCGGRLTGGAVTMGKVQPVVKSMGVQRGVQGNEISWQAQKLTLICDAGRLPVPKVKVLDVGLKISNASVLSGQLTPLTGPVQE